jgi:PKD repeat protein
MNRISLAAACFAAAVLAGCTVHQTEAPDLTGPSELALSVTMTASPDSITQDGRSNSTITLTARDASGRSASNVSFRLDMIVDNQIGDYGTLSTRSITTGSDGRATVTYTAPPAPLPGTAVAACTGSGTGDSTIGRCVKIQATNIGTDYSSAASHYVLIHLMPQGIIIPGSATPSPKFTTIPDPPTANTVTQFDASTSCAGQPSNGQCPGTAGTILSYSWNFGDGGTATGMRVSHTFSKQQTYVVTLTIVNDLGLQASTTQYIAVGQGVKPTPAFIYSPTSPAPNQQITFDANKSEPGPGHSIVRFVWSFGDGSGIVDTTSPFTTHTFTTTGGYIVSLTVSDEAGQSATTTQTVNVGSALPTASFVFSPTTLTVATIQPVNFDASASKAAPGQTIVEYQWNFNGTIVTKSTPQASWTPPAAANSYPVVLKVTDSSGQFATATVPVKVDP